MGKNQVLVCNSVASEQINIWLPKNLEQNMVGGGAREEVNYFSVQFNRELFTDSCLKRVDSSENCASAYTEFVG